MTESCLLSLKPKNMALRITNITCHFKVDCRFSLDAVCSQPLVCESKATTVGGKTRRFKSAVESIITGENIVTALIYESGSVVLVGAKSQDVAREALASFLSNHACNITKPLTFSNFAMTFAVTHRLDLRSLYNDVVSGKHKLLTCPIYEVEIFPSLLVSRRHTNTKASIFHTGKVIITGCRTPHDGDIMYSLLLSLFSQ